MTVALESSIDLSKHDPEQAKLMEEEIAVVDNDDRVLGHSSKKACHLMENINKGLLHRAFSVFLFNPEGKLLLQQRAASKITFPLMWTNTCCSHMMPTAAELDTTNHLGAKRAAQRKLFHELGIRAEEMPLDAFHFLTRIHYLAPSDGLWGEHEIDYILFARNMTVNVNCNYNECADFKYVSKEELKELLDKVGKDDTVSITPWFKLICEKFLFKWWDRLDTVEEMQDSKTIHRLL